MKLCRTTEFESTGDYQVGDVITFTLIYGKYVEALAVKQEQDGMVFVFLDCFRELYPMNYTLHKGGGYENSDLRKVLNSETVKIFPEEFRKDMLAFPNGDFLRLPTEVEILGNNLFGEWANPDVVHWVPMIRSRNCIALRGGKRQEPIRYWLINEAIYVADDAFACIDIKGDIDSERAVEPLGVRPVFKLK